MFVEVVWCRDGDWGDLELLSIDSKCICGLGELLIEKKVGFL